MNGQLTGYDQSANELSSNLNTVKFHFSLDNYHQLLRMKSSGATAGCPSDWMGTGIKFAVTFLGSGRATTMTGYGTDHPLEEGETAVTSQFVIKLSASNQPGNVSAPIVLWCRTEHELVVLIPTSERKFFRVEMNTTTGSAIIQKVVFARRVRTDLDFTVLSGGETESLRLNPQGISIVAPGFVGDGFFANRQLGELEWALGGDLPEIGRCLLRACRSGAAEQKVDLERCMTLMGCAVKRGDAMSSITSPSAKRSILSFFGFKIEEGTPDSLRTLQQSGWAPFKRRRIIE